MTKHLFITKLMTVRYSKLAGESLAMGNVNIADLSDPNRPTKLAEQFSELYDNDWTDAFEELARFEDEEEKIMFLLKILKVRTSIYVSFDYCPMQMFEMCC